MITRFLFVSPGFPPQYRLFVDALVERGVQVIGVGDMHPSLMNAELLAKLHAYVYCPSLEERQDVVRAVGDALVRRGPVDVVESFNEHWLELDAVLRDAFDVPGPRSSELRRRRDKNAMHEVFARHGIPMPRSHEIVSAASLTSFVQEVGGPVIVKPRYGVGAQGVFVVEAGSVSDHLDGIDLRDYVAQEKIEGTVVTYDGLVDDTGHVSFAVSFRYAAGVLEVVRDKLDVWYATQRHMPAALEELGQRILGAFGVRKSFFHIEMFETGPGQYVALEINFRPPGGFSTDLMNYACDVDVYRLYAQIITSAGEAVPFEYAYEYHAAHVGRRPRPYELDVDAARELLGPALMVQTDLPPVIGEAMGSPVFLIRHAEESELRRLIERITS